MSKKSLKPVVAAIGAAFAGSMLWRALLVPSATPSACPN